MFFGASDLPVVGRLAPSVCLFVCLFVSSITQKRMTPKCLNFVQRMILGCLTITMVLGLKGQRSRLGLGLGLRAIRRRGFELYECLLAMTANSVRFHASAVGLLLCCLFICLFVDKITQKVVEECS